MMFRQQPDIDQMTMEKLKQRFPEGILREEFITDMLVITVDKEVLFDLIRFLKEEPELQYTFLTTLCGIHYPDSDLPWGMVYHLHSMTLNHRLRIKVFNNTDDVHFPSMTPLFPTANWMERETYDFFGFLFDGHPGLKRILNVDDFEGFPLRKDFPLEDQTREDKNDAMFGR